MSSVSKLSGLEQGLSVLVDFSVNYSTESFENVLLSVLLAKYGDLALWTVSWALPFILYINKNADHAGLSLPHHQRGQFPPSPSFHFSPCLVFFFFFP